ncbi:MAG: metal-dependent hydrolase [Sandaracinaceae bacterium]
MASLGHVAVGLAAGRLHARERPVKWMGAFALLSLAPDLDVIGFSFGIPYEAALGHRGASHSLLVGLLGLACALAPGPQRLRAGLLGAGVLLSHGVLDALTTGGLGVAFFWPFDDTRFFFPLRPIPVAPIGRGMVSGRGLYVLAAEALLFSPALLYALWPRRAFKGTSRGSPRAEPASASARPSSPSPRGSERDPRG